MHSTISCSRFRVFAAVAFAIILPVLAPGQTSPSPTAATASGTASPKPPHKQFVDNIPPGVQIVSDLEYVPGGGAAQSLDLYLPQAGMQPRLLVVYIHGGGWNSGTKNDWHPSFHDLLEHGFAVASLNYRLTGQAIWPAQIYDCKAAIRWLRAHAADYHIDPNHIGVWGHSAGGHLAALLGTSNGVKELEGTEGDQKVMGTSSAVQAACDWSGPTDMDLVLKEGNAQWHALYTLVVAFLGGPNAAPGNTKASSPLTYVNAKCPPFLLMQGDKDNVVPLEQTAVLDDALKKAGVDSTRILIPNAGHGPVGQATLTPVTQFFTKNLKN